MPPEAIVNGNAYISLEDALANEPPPPSLISEFSVLLVGVLRPNAADGYGSDDATAVRLYPPDGRDDQYYLIKKTDVDADRVEVVNPRVVAGRGWITDRVVRIRVRPGAQVFDVQARSIEAQQICDVRNATGGPCRPGLTCSGGYYCTTSAASGLKVCKKGASEVPCPECI